VHNTGGQAITGATAELVERLLPDGSGNVIATSPIERLSAGDTLTVTFSVARPASGSRSYMVRLVPPDAIDESSRADNQATLGADVAVTSLPPLYDMPGGAMVRAELRPSSGLPPAGVVTGTLTLGEPDGRELEQLHIRFPSTPSETIPITSWVALEDLGPGRHSVYINVDPADTLGDQSPGDNSVQTTVQVLPDLLAEEALVEWGRGPGSTTPVQLWIYNGGNWPGAGAAVTFYDAPAGTPGRQMLGSLPIQTIEPGAYAPLSGTLNLQGSPAATTGLQRLYVEIDEMGTMEELDENNNAIVVGDVFGTLPAQSPRRIHLPLLLR
jgi:hypothetical protein